MNELRLSNTSNVKSNTCSTISIVKLAIIYYLLFEPLFLILAVR